MGWFTIINISKQRHDVAAGKPSVAQPLYHVSAIIGYFRTRYAIGRQFFRAIVHIWKSSDCYTAAYKKR